MKSGGIVAESSSSTHSVAEESLLPEEHPTHVEYALPFQEDWSFAHLTPRHTLWGPHGYHRYPAKFIPHVVRRIIDRYSLPDERVGDPFLGSATTGIEALRAKRYFYGSDIHPVALLISKAKCRAIEPLQLNLAWNKLQLRITPFPHIERRPLTEQELEAITSINIAHATKEERFAYWFPVHHRYVLSLILEAIQEFTEEKIRIFFLCAFSNILRTCSIWLSGSTKPQKDLRKILGDPVEEFSRQVQSMLKRNSLYWKDLGNWVQSIDEIEQRVTIVQEDVRHLSLADETLDLLVTSPPYATCYEYSEMHQLTQLWFEKYNIFQHSPYSYIGTKIISRRQALQSNEEFALNAFSAGGALQCLQDRAIGNISRDVNQEVRALHHYFQDMYDALHECARVVTMHKRLVLIIGDSYRRGIIIPTSQTLCEMAIHVGFTLEKKIVRRIPGRVLVPTRDKQTGRFSSLTQNSTQAYPEETILILQRRF
jgi:DNA modification methylase